MTKFSAIPVAAIFALIVATTASAAATNPGPVNAGSPVAPFSQNKQNEPALAVDANNPNVLVAGANDNIDMEACNAGNATTCPFTNCAAASGANDQNAWQHPVVISKQSSTTFSDKEQIWADNAESSPFFGTVYVCWAAFRGQEKGNAAPAPLQVAVSHDGGDTWTQHQVSGAANNSQRNPEDGCTIRTDSHGNAYVFGVGTVASLGKQAFEMMAVS